MKILCAALVLGLALAITSSLVSETVYKCPIRCDCLNHGNGILVNCSDRDLQKFPIIPENLREEVVELDVSHNPLWRLSGSAPPLPRLVALSLADAELLGLPDHWLRRLPSLRRLDLSGNRNLKLSGLGEGLLASAKNLQLLNLSRCGAIDTLEGAEAALISSTLQVLDLSNCRLSELTGKLLTGLPVLRRLDLSYNPLHLLHGLNSSTLQELRLVRTGLQDIHHAALLDLPALQALDVSDNRGLTLRGGCILSAALIVLRADSCRLLLQNLKLFPNLHYAALQHNNIEEIWNTSFYNIFIDEIDFSNNNIQKIHPESFQTLPHLKKISLANNKILAIDPYVFVKNDILEYVNLSNNPLWDFGNMLVPRLVTLDVSQCNIKKLSADGLRGMPALESLNLSSNHLEYIPNNLTSDSLKWLDLSFCRLASISNDSFRGLPALMELDLSGNRFTEPFGAQHFASNARLRALRLRDNPWRCDCASQSFRRFAEYTLSVDQLEATERARCASPQHLQDQSWLQACKDVWHPLAKNEPERSNGVVMQAVVKAMVMVTVVAVTVLAALLGRALVFLYFKILGRQRSETQATQGNTPLLES